MFFAASRAAACPSSAFVSKTSNCNASPFLLSGFLCATSVFSVSLWLIYPSRDKPQRHREHRGCTEKAMVKEFAMRGLSRIFLLRRARVDSLRHLRNSELAVSFPQAL